MTRFSPTVSGEQPDYTACRLLATGTDQIFSITHRRFLQTYHSTQPNPRQKFVSVIWRIVQKIAFSKWRSLPLAYFSTFFSFSQLRLTPRAFRTIHRTSHFILGMYFSIDIFSDRFLITRLNNNLIYFSYICIYSTILPM